MSPPSNIIAPEAGRFPKLFDCCLFPSQKSAAGHGIPFRVQNVGSMGCMYFSDRPVENFADAAATDTDRFYRFHASMLERGIYLAPSPYEAFFVGAGHGPEEVEKTLAAADATFAEL